MSTFSFKRGTSGGSRGLEGGARGLAISFKCGASDRFRGEGG